jgi:tetratricopeptide (TPR) repeat protein
MRYCRNYVKAFLIVGLLFSFGLSDLQVSQASEGLKFRIEAREKFLLWEAVVIQLALTNQSETEIEIKSLHTPYEMLRIYLVNSEGDSLRYRGPFWSYSGEIPGVTVKPGETYEHTLNLLDSYGAKADSLFMRLFLKPDTYMVQMSYRGTFSNKITFQVVMPEGDGKSAYDLFKEAHDHYIKLGHEKAITALEEFIQKYPKSVYAAEAYYEIAQHYDMIEQPEKTKEHLENLILNYPDSYFVRYAFWGLLRPKSEEQKMKYLEKIIQEKPGTGAAKWAKKSLEVLKTEK